MSGFPRSLLLTTAILAAAPLAGLSDPTPEERAENHRKVEKWRADPALFARLRGDALAFLQMPAPRQEQVLKLDRELHALPVPAQAHLLDVARRYAAWLDRLPEADRQMVKEAPDPKTRLQRIRELREKEWIRRLPRKQREKLEQAQGAERERLVQQFRRVELQRRTEWQKAFQHWDELVKKQPMPATLADFPPEVQTYVNEYLHPYLLGPKEKIALERAQGDWLAFPYLLVSVADRHPMALPGTKGPTQFSELPAEVQKRLSTRVKKQGNAPALKKVEGKWPQYGAVVTLLARKNQLRLPYELWPSRREDLSAPVGNFLDKELWPALNDGEKDRLKKAESIWPLYPRTIQALAQQHKLQVPWQTLPGPREKWDSFRLRPLGPPRLLANPALLKAGPLTP